MAADWIHVRTAIHDDPAVVRIAMSLDVDEDLVVGKLIRFWGWADQHVRDGNSIGVSLAWIDRFARMQGLATAMIREGWLFTNGDAIGIPHFDRWFGESAKKRLQHNRRVADYRERSRITKSDTEASREDHRCSANGDTDRATNASTRVEKRREENTARTASEEIADAFADADLSPTEIGPPEPSKPIPPAHVAIVEDAIGRPIDPQRGEPAIVRALARLCGTSPPEIVADFVRKGVAKCGAERLNRVAAYVQGCTVLGPNGPMLQPAQRANAPPRKPSIPRAATVARLDL